MTTTGYRCRLIISLFSKSVMQIFFEFIQSLSLGHSTHFILSSPKLRFNILIISNVHYLVKKSLFSLSLLLMNVLTKNSVMRQKVSSSFNTLTP